MLPKSNRKSINQILTPLILETMNKIVNTLNNQLQELATETIQNMLQEVDVNELKELKNEDDVQEFVNELIDANYCYQESFYYFDTYYQETASRGDSGEVCQAIREELENQYMDYLLEDNQQLKVLEGVHRANYLVNLYAEAMCMNFAYLENGLEFVQTLIQE